MKVTYNWLKDFVAIKLSPEKLADKLTMAGIEVKGIEAKGDDFVFEIEITSNRPDWLSVVGIAREVAAVTSAKLKAQSAKCKCKAQSGKKSPFTISVENKKDCSLYTATIIRGVRVGSAPDWMRARLEAVGVRSINNIVDITNYCLLEQGEPLHAFDLDRLAGDTIVVRRAKTGEMLETIDGVRRQLDPEMLVIADAAHPCALAGIMGGKSSEVTGATQNILLEAAIFDAGLTRRSRQKNALQTDSSYRFERGIDAVTLQQGRMRAIKLILENAGGDVVLAAQKGQEQKPAGKILFDCRLPQKILGVAIPPAKIKTALTYLGFRVQAQSKHLVVQVPAYRRDVKDPIDLVEEVARIYGFEHIPTTLPRVLSQQEFFQPDVNVLTRNVLVGLGLHEAITYSLVDRQSLDGFVFDQSAPVEVANPLSKEQEMLRTTILPSLLKSVVLNLNQKQEWVGFFEIAKNFSQRPVSLPQEEGALAIVLCGKQSRLSEAGRITHEASLLDIKGILEALCLRLGVASLFFAADGGGGYDIRLGETRIGCVKEIDAGLLDRFGIKNRRVFAAELSVSLLYNARELKKKFVPLPLYPGIVRDMSVVVKEEISAGEMFVVMKEAGKPLLDEVIVIDYYKGVHIPQGHKNLTISCTYRSNERTLTESEVQPVHDAVVSKLVQQFGIQLR